MTTTAARYDLGELLDLVQEHVPPAVEDWLPRRVTPNSGRCLPSTRIGLEVLRYFGVKAEPMMTRALSVNAAWQEWMHGPSGGEGEMPEAAWSVAVGWPLGDGPGLDGHLVLAVEGHLLDLDAGQLGRPARGILVPPTLLLPLLDHKGFRVAGAELPDGARVDYGEHPEPPRWRQAGDWRKSARPAGPVIRRVRAALEAQP